MKQARLTHLLVALVVFASIMTALSLSRLSNSREEALATGHDLERVAANLNDLRVWHVTAGPLSSNGTSDPELNRRVREAATAATLTDQILSIEPGPSVRVRDSDTLRTPIYLRLDGVTLRQVVTFIHGMISSDSTLRVTGVELSVPQVPDAQGAKSAGERWLADLTLSKSTIAPTGKPPR